MEEQAQTARRGKAHVKDPVRYKTVLCNKYETFGKCPYGPRCQFAHGPAELRDRRPLKPTNSQADGRPLAPPPLNVCHMITPAAPQVTPPPTPRQLRPSPPPLPKKTPIAEHSEYSSERSSEAGTSCRLCEETPPFDGDALAPLHVDKLSGQVICRRDASHNTLSVRRAISFLFDDASEGGAPLQFSWPWSGVDLTPIESTAEAITSPPMNAPGFLAI